MWVIVNIRLGTKLTTEFTDFNKAVDYRNQLNLPVRDWTVMSLEAYRREFL